MPGYELTTEGDYARLDSLLCPWCGLILREALQTESGIRVCQTCYDEIQKAPDHRNPQTENVVELEPNETYHPDIAVRKEVERLVVKCANHNQGCPWTGPLKRHEDEHRRDCQYKTIQCQNDGCGMEIMVSEYEDHKLRACQYRHMNCVHCGIDLVAKEEQFHIAKCSRVKKPCDSCGESLLRDELYLHELLECQIARHCVGCDNRVPVRGEPGVEVVNTHLGSPARVFEHVQNVGVKVFHVDRSVKKLEEDLNEARQHISEDHDKICGLQESLPEVLKMKKLLSYVQALADGEVVRKLEQRMDRMESRAGKQDQIIASLRGTSGSVAGSSPSYLPSNVASSNMEEYPPGDRVSNLERKTEELERTTAMLKVNMSELELQLQASLASTYNGSFLWRIPEVKKRKRDAMESRITSIYSPPFYTGRNGYKMCIRAYLNGDGIGYNTHLSIFFVLMKGEYDPLLKWPFDYKVSLIMVDQEHRRHIVQTFKPSPSSGSFQQPKSDMNIASGCPKFAELKVLENENYVKDDVLYIKCIVDVARIFHP